MKKKYLVAVATAVLLVSGCASTGSAGVATDADGSAMQGSADSSTQKSEQPTKPDYTKSQEQAIGAAEDYLQFQAISKKGLIDQLSSDYGEQFTKAEATYAAKKVGLC